MGTPLNEGPTGLFVAIGGWMVSLLLGLFVYVTQMRRGGVEETAVVLGKWKELVEAHEKQISTLQSEISALRNRVRELEDSLEEKMKEIEQLRRDLDGERRQAKQQARSFREQLKRMGWNEGGRFDEQP